MGHALGKITVIKRGLIIYAKDHQGHVVPLRTAIGKGPDLIQDASDDLCRCDDRGSAVVEANQHMHDAHRFERHVIF